MNSIKFFRKAALVALFSFIIVSCASLQSGVNQVKVGMSRDQVTKLMGYNSQVVSMVQTSEGPLEVLRYKDEIAEGGKFVTKGYYLLHFLNDKLVELNYEDARMRPDRPWRRDNRP